MTTFIALLRSLAAYLFVSLYVIVVGTPLIAIALVVRSPALLYWAGLIGVRGGMLLSGIRCRAEGTEHIQSGRAGVYAINHASNLEPPIAFAVLRRLFPRLGVLYKAELRKLPILVWGFDLAGFVPLERGNRDQSLPAIERAADALRRGMSFMIFPEGTRSRTGELLPFKKGGFIMAIKGQAPIVPMAVKGARDAMRKGSPIIRPVIVRVRLGEPIETRGMTLEDRDRVIAETRTRIETMLEDL
ncbi:MAG TPA: lysophospholipid acyltransferase family protein [Vicinamibacterales bacterium]|nr:lysophospholipid acyltransferase family protein [Vicinamibacterales bacterium]